MPFIKVENLHKSFGKNEVLKGVSFEIEKGDVVAVIGPSGSGKSTMLRSLIHLETLNDGSVEIDGQSLIRNGVYSSNSEIKKITSKMGMVFQHFQLFPHLTVAKNLELALKLKNIYTKEEIENKRNILLGKVGLSDKADAMPSNLSGGQKQRVAIARALMLQPEVMLFDEPTSALDPELTGGVLKVMRELASEHMTMIVVTHEMAFAREAANKILFMDEGVILEQGTPEEVFDNPKNQRAKDFISMILHS